MSSTIQWSFVYISTRTVCICAVIPPYFTKELIQKMKLLFCDDCRNNVLLQLKFVFMTFESQNDCIRGTPTSIQPKIILPPLQNGIDSALKNLTLHTAYCHLRMTSHRHTRTYVLPARTSSTTSCISVICGRNSCTNTHCLCGDTYITPLYCIGHSSGYNL